MKIIKRMMIGFICSSIVFGLCLAAFILGCVLCYSPDKLLQEYGIFFIILSFPVGIIAMGLVVKCYIRIKGVLYYGMPVNQAAEHIREIVNKSTISGVEKLHGIMDEAVQKELQKVIDGKNS